MKKINCKHYCEDYLLEGMCKLYSDWSDPIPIVVYCCNDEYCKHIKPITNFDRIKKANKEELAEIFMEYAFAVKADCNSGNCAYNKEDWLKWLDKEAEIEQND